MKDSVRLFFNSYEKKENFKTSHKKKLINVWKDT